ncbi:hypothetical protein [uncultured Gemmiger sp.]|uniref:hypothetical protein n=1 Tax=uncultured Gemmiger sp. TaxID=1623490 RepID=UPI0025E7DA58|nr:hypothetical protein [uncultured Gemmiger sp.]
MKRIAALLMAVCLLAGCSGSAGQGLAQLPSAPAAPAAETLRVSCDAPDPSALRTALTRYGEEQDVTIEWVEDAASADLALLTSLPEGDGWLDLAAQPSLSAAVSRAGADTAGPVTALPLGRSLYAYWVNTDLLSALLGDTALADLQNASWNEWRNFVLSVTGWMVGPTTIPLTLNGNTYAMPAERTDATANLDGVFAIPGAEPVSAWAGPLYTSALLAAGGNYNTDALTGPVSGVYTALTLELQNTAGSTDRTFADAVNAMAGGEALFCRGTLADLTAVLGVDGVQALSPVPVKCYFVNSDLSTQEYNLTGLMDYPALACAGYLAIPAGSANTAGAASAILWLYSSAEGSHVLTDELLLLTPWNTASDATAQGAQQIRIISTGILPEVALTDAQNASLARAGADLTGTDPASFTAWTRRVFLDAALPALTG